MTKQEIKQKLSDICDARLKLLGEYEYYKDRSLEVRFWRVTGLVDNDIEEIIDTYDDDELNTVLNKFNFYVPSGAGFENSSTPTPKHDYSKDYLTTEALESGTISFNIWSTMGTNYITSISYSIDDGKTWTTNNNKNDKEENLVIEVEVNEGDKVLWKGDAQQTGYYDENKGTYVGSFFSSDCEFNVYGNIMSMLYDDDFTDKTEITNRGCFANLFYDYDEFLSCSVVNTSNLILPATTLEIACYRNMFKFCTSLVTAPELPATTLANYCYASMFSNCSSLETAHELPATTLANHCYRSMFSDCTSLTFAPELPATTLAIYCYTSMFEGCTSLVTAPDLPATTLSPSCYESMFRSCTSLETAPELPATTLVMSCYTSMFRNCTSLETAPDLPATTLAYSCCDGMFQSCTALTSAPELPATTLANSCYEYMFKDCTALETAPELPATTLASTCYYSMFQGCSKLNYVKALFTTDPSSSLDTNNWLSGVSSTGTFERNPEATWNVSGVSGIPEGWNVEPPFPTAPQE